MSPSDQWSDNGDPVVDFSGDSRARRTFKDRAQMSEYGDMDLASGFPSSLIWTTKDGRRIAIPNMTDDHLLNTIAFIRRRAEQYKRQVAVQFLMRVTGTMMMFDHLPEDVIDSYSEKASVKLKELQDMDPEAFLRTIFPIYSLLYQEAYKRKILIEVDATKVEEAPRRIRKKPIKKPKPTFEECVESWAQAARDTDGVEVPQGCWHFAQEAVNKYPTEFGLGSARGPDRSWKRLYLINGSGNT